MTANYGEGLNVEWSEFEYDKLREIKARSVKERGKAARKAAVLQLHASGVPKEQIADIVGLSRPQISDLIKGRKHVAHVPLSTRHTHMAHNFFMGDFDRSGYRSMRRRYSESGEVLRVDTYF